MVLMDYRRFGSRNSEVRVGWELGRSPGPRLNGLPVVVESFLLRTGNLQQRPSKAVAII